MIIEGSISVKAAMLGGKRKVTKIYLDQSRHDKDAHFIERKALELGIQIQKTERSRIDSIASGRTHGGVIADASERAYQTIEECLSLNNPFLVLLEGVEDPYNLGYVMRSLYCAGCNGLILRNRDWQSSEATILRSSAGASEYLRIVQMNPEEAVEECHARGLKTYAAMRKEAITMYEADFKVPLLLCIGGEMRGLSSKVLSRIDQNIYIPYANDFRNALNAAGASAVLGYEVFRQRTVVSNA